MLVDFHMHSTASDGTFNPNELVTLVKERKIECFSLTDHDTIDGVKQIKEKNFIPGVEISIEHPTTLHILGYGFDINNEKFNKVLDQLKQYRYERNVKMVEKANALGFDITLEELLEEANGTLIGRPHFASLLLKKGYVKDRKEAFEKYLKRGMPLYEDKKRLDLENAIEIITQAGGIAVFAHPYQTSEDEDEIEKLLKKMVDLGLKGIEVYYSKHTKGMIETYEKLAKKYNLVKTAGSDFHGQNTPDIELGIEVRRENIKEFLSLF
ncbi:PHP domain protein [Thermosipho africanus H17ap60334]|uniref:PHP domain protein n=1 Tax=Thermosipho africanus (strain TCF52B) TaxID=484019 RepID=B7IGZ3_THEAB|nr:MULTISPECIES: PHP domain-containing protein [Thermosipho]ACJ75357.1 PHP domain protein [Thermosipho africanus TCF52B]EKF50176.1 PHP domain protein [Thermosipho africanus H17ap60334]MBZ4651088.1 hypothetical protein [Thermosipho sp. (in: thermotogales)]RDI90797.1 PHP domain protein [Thermosipho africanus Ob7]